MSGLCFLVFWLLHFIVEQNALPWVPPQLRPFLGRSFSSPLLRNPLCCDSSPQSPLEILTSIYREARYQNRGFGEATDYITMQRKKENRKIIENTSMLLKEYDDLLTNANGNQMASRPEIGKYSNGDDMPKPEEKNAGDEKRDDNKALKCSLLECTEEDTKGPVCACNFQTGNTVSFKNECDIKKHNCRFDTQFKIIMHEICPWQFESRSGGVADADEKFIK